MRIALLGATGGIGGHVLGWALESGHTVQALARTPEALHPAPGLTVVQGNALDADSVTEVVDGAQAVVSALGPRGAKAPGLLAGAAANTVVAMAKTAAQRLVCVSAAGAFISTDSNMAWLIKSVLPRVLATQFADVRRMEDVVRASGLDWTLVRASRLTNKPLMGHYRVAPDYPPPGGGKITRADVAHFIAHALTDGTWLHASPALAY
ncbi:MAG TPA: NAD(P)-binding oxidoreductase [Streptosporangiaceae bacterium]|nr:NAD(P)-binding oxidoreductase [Streptosporangiaceae bacterium]